MELHKKRWNGTQEMCGDLMEKFSENIERHEDTNPRSSEAIKQDK
jgi:hypothetical protein